MATATDTDLSGRAACLQEVAALKTWLFGSALGLWWESGADSRHGGFHERLGLDGVPLAEERRTRVQPRQVYVYALAGRMGWPGPWQAAVEHGLAFFDRTHLLADGTVRARVADDGAPADDTFDLYNQAFALLCYAVVTPARTQAARSLLAILERDYRHPVAGFEEARPRSLPLKSNPHMHLFEACLAWGEAGGGEKWEALADEIASLCLTRFIDADTGALREFFDGDWKPMPGEDGRIVEPGHQYEWAWLLARWSVLRDRPDALAAARRLFTIAETCGMDNARGVAVMQLNDDFTVRDPVARLWPQTERIKSAAILARLATDDAERDRYWTIAAEACRSLWRYFDVPLAGLWRDKLKPDGAFVEEPAPASSFYHIACAIDVLETELG